MDFISTRSIIDQNCCNTNGKEETKCSKFYSLSSDFLFSKKGGI